MDKGASASADRAFVPSGSSRVAPSRPAASIPSAGETFTAVYPFVRDTYTAIDEEGGFEAPTWKPGVRFESLPPYGEDTGAVADGEGLVHFSVVATFKPGHYPVRGNLCVIPLPQDRGPKSKLSERIRACKPIKRRETVDA